MIMLDKQISNYMDFCQYQKNLNYKTIKAYTVDLKQFSCFAGQDEYPVSRGSVSNYVTYLHKKYKPKCVKRKIASLKAFFNYLEFEEILKENPFAKLKVRFQEPFILPRTISADIIEVLLKTAYQLTTQNNDTCNNDKTIFKHKTILRDIAVLELLFATGIRVSELCSLHSEDIHLQDGTVKIYGKGSKERIVQIENTDVRAALIRYKTAFEQLIHESGYFFVNRLHKRLSEQSVRLMIHKYVKMAGITSHITPHMFRHSFATLLLEEDVDIRYIQKLLGHSSIVTTQIYTHVASNKQRDILALKHPRNKMQV